MFDEEEEDEVGMKYLVYLMDVGRQVFLFFRTTRRRRRWGWNNFGEFCGCGDACFSRRGGEGGGKVTLCECGD
jgi:hypothetical protein